MGWRVSFSGALLACLLVGACQPRKMGADAPETTEGDGTLIEDSDLNPAALPGEEAQLVYGGTKVPVTLAQERKDGDLTLKIFTHNELSDTEVYRVGEDRFSLVNAAGEVYTPPIDLLRFPLRIGSTWDWSGTMTAGGLEKKATARVETAKDKLFPDTVPMEAVKVTVHLEIDANPPDGPKAKRDLTFWFSEGKGVVRREFGTASVREPRPEP